MNRPVVSERFDVDDIRRIREYNSVRHASMTREEIVADTKKKAAKLLQRLNEKRCVTQL